MNIYYRLTAQSPVVRAQANTILIGTMLGLGPLTLWLATTPFHKFLAATPWQQFFEFSPYLFLPIVIFPAAIGYTILRFRFLRTDTWLRHGLVYAILAFIVLAGYGMVASGISLIVTAAVPWTNLWVGVFVFAVVVTLEPVRTRLQDFVDATFFRGQRVYAERISNFSHDLTTALDLNKISVILREQIGSSLAPEQVHIYTFDAVNDQFIALPGEDSRATSDIRFSEKSPLANYFSKEHLPLYLDGVSLPPVLEAEKSRLALLGARLFVGLR